MWRGASSLILRVHRPTPTNSRCAVPVGLRGCIWPGVLVDAKSGGDGHGLDGLGWLLAGLGGSDPRQRTVHAIRDGLRENFRPHIDGVAGFVSHGLGGFDGRSPKHFDCFLFIHAAL